MYSALAAGGGPDMGQIEMRSIPEFILVNGLVDLARYGANDHAGRFDPTLWSQVSFTGGVYGVPQDSGPMGFYYQTELDGAETLVISFASMGRVAKGVVVELRSQGYKVGLIRPFTMWPFFKEELRDIVNHVKPKKIVIPEINYGQLRLLVEWALKGFDVPVLGVNVVNGDLIPPELIEEAILHG